MCMKVRTTRYLMLSPRIQIALARLQQGAAIGAAGHWQTRRGLRQCAVGRADILQLRRGTFHGAANGGDAQSLPEQVTAGSQASVQLRQRINQSINKHPSNDWSIAMHHTADQWEGARREKQLEKHARWWRRR